MINEESLKKWEKDHIELLTSREMGEWLHRRDHRRDMNARSQVAYLCKYHKEPHCCKHTTRIEDALNFEKLEDGKYLEVERPQGRWINKNPLNRYAECSECHYWNSISRYCPECGADMRGKEE